MTLQVVQSQARNSHHPHQTLRCCLWPIYKKTLETLWYILWLKYYKWINKLLDSLSGPPSWFTASTNLWCSSGVHFNLGFASVDKTKFMFWFCIFCRPICVLWMRYRGRWLKHKYWFLISSGWICGSYSSLYNLEELLACPMFSLHIWKHKWGYVGGIYAMSCGSSFLSFPISYHFPFSFLFFLYYNMYFFMLLWLERGRENLWCSKNRESQHISIWVLKGEKRGKVYGLFLSCCFPISLSLSTSLCLIPYWIR